MGFDMTAYSLSKETDDTIYQNEISNFHAFYSDPNIGVLEELMEILPPIKVANSEWDVDVFDGICSIESIKNANAKTDYIGLTWAESRYEVIY